MPRSLVRTFRWCVVLALVAGVSLVARADDVSIRVVSVALKGNGYPSVQVSVEKPLVSLEINLDRSDGQAVHFHASRVPAGEQRSFKLKQPEGTFHYEGKAIARFRRGPPQELKVSFDASLFGPLQLSVTDHAVDLKAHSVTLEADRAIDTVHVQVWSDDGQSLAEYDQDFKTSKADQPVTTTWDSSDPSATVLRIHVRATDRYGIFRDIYFYPWKIEIPHQDVLFDTGKSEIVETERPKVDAAYQKLAADIAKYGRWAKVQLFVAGYTDTVGNAAMNQTLSEARALSIARYFRSRGVRIPIYYTGFGETGLLVPTADETPEPRNRRAAYIVSVETPPGAKWTRLR